MRYIVSIMLFTVIFAFLALFSSQKVNAQIEYCTNILDITSGSELTPYVTWTVPASKANSYFTFNVELWSASSGPGQPAVYRKIGTIGTTRTGQDGNTGQNYRVNGVLPPFTPDERTSYFIAVYGYEYPLGPVQSQILPWTPVYYDIQYVIVNRP
jgi:hypothetical protein